MSHSKKRENPPIIRTDICFLNVQDSEPLDFDPAPNWEDNKIEVQCRLLPLGEGSYRLVSSGNSKSSNNIEAQYDSVENTLEISINTIDENDGNSFGNEMTYETSPDYDYVFANITKGGKRVGKTKHKILYGDREENMQ